jgi:hypothetical protein
MTRHALRGLLLAMLMTGCATAPEPPPRVASPGILVAGVCTAQANVWRPGRCSRVSGRARVWRSSRPCARAVPHARPRAAAR